MTLEVEILLKMSCLAATVPSSPPSCRLVFLTPAGGGAGGVAELARGRGTLGAGAGAALGSATHYC